MVEEVDINELVNTLMDVSLDVYGENASPNQQQMKNNESVASHRYSNDY
jgi:hypothetical protein